MFGLFRAHVFCGLDAFAAACALGAFTTLAAFTPTAAPTEVPVLPPPSKNWPVLPVLVTARDELKAQSLWEPAEGPLRAERDAHPSWRKYCEFLPRAQQAAMEVRPYRTTPLVSGMDGLIARVTAAEKGFREG